MPRNLAMKTLPNLLMPAIFSLVCSAPSLVQAATACTVSTTSVAFGTYSSIRNVSRESTGSVDVSCTDTVGNTVSYAIALTPGTGSYAARQLASGADRLGYNLFTDSARTLVWGDGTSGTSTVSDSYRLVVSPTARAYPVYGLIPGGQNLTRVGSYSDSITVSVSY
jgi:spore coat protein U-like protein